MRSGVWANIFFFVVRAKRASKMQISFEDKAFTTNRGRKAFKTSAFLKDRKKHMLQLLSQSQLSFVLYFSLLFACEVYTRLNVCFVCGSVISEK